MRNDCSGKINLIWSFIRTKCGALNGGGLNRGVLLTCMVIAIVGSCFAKAFSEPADAETPGMVVRQVLPSNTAGAIDTFSGADFQHWVWYSPTAIDRHQLLVFLPGTGGKGKGSGKFNKAAANCGYHVVSLAYPDAISISKFRNSDDPSAFSKARMNVIAGAAPYGRLQVNRANSIENRLIALLRYLAKQYPREHWEQFLDAHQNPTWDKLVLAGQSQGGGHACFIAIKMHKVARVLMFGAPKDYNLHFDKPGQWLSQESVTPINRFFCFNHSDDSHNGCTYQQQVRNYRALGLLPTYKVFNVDVAAPPFEHTRLLTSTVQQDEPHGAPVHDPRYKPVWMYMLLEPVE